MKTITRKLSINTHASVHMCVFTFVRRAKVWNQKATKFRKSDGEVNMKLEDMCTVSIKGGLPRLLLNNSGEGVYPGLEVKVHNPGGGRWRCSQWTTEVETSS